MVLGLLNPAQFRILLAGPRVSRLQPFFTARGYVADAYARGSEAWAVLQQSPRHIVLLELDLDDMLCGDLLTRMRQAHVAGAVLLLEDPAKTGLIVSNLIRGVDGYVATPPDEEYLFRLVERQLLAQWALAQGAQDAQAAEDKARLERLLAQERAKITDLVKELGTLRTELNELKKQQKLAAQAPATRASSAGKTLVKPKLEESEATVTRAMGSSAPPYAKSSLDGHSAFEDETAPRGIETAPRPTFEEESAEHTRMGDPRQPSQPPHPAPPATSHPDDNDLFLLLDDGTGSTRIDAGGGATGDDDLIELDD